MDYKNISRKQKSRERQDDGMGRMRCLFGRHLVRTKNPVARIAGRSQFVLTHPVHPVKKVLSGEAVAKSRLDGDGTNYERPALRAVSAHRDGALAPVRGSMRKSLICRVALRKSLIFTIFLDISRGSCGVHWRLRYSSRKFRFSLCNSLISMIVSDSSRFLAVFGGIENLTLSFHDGLG